MQGNFDVRYLWLGGAGSSAQWITTTGLARQNLRLGWRTITGIGCHHHWNTHRVMEADLFNLYPSVGEVNGDRSNFQYGMVRSAPQYGACSTRIDFSGKAAEPRDEVKGLVARATFYMYDRYGLSMSRKQQQLLMAWDRQYPVTTSERRWESRTAAVMGHNNPFVTGERSWTLGYKSTRDGLVSLLPAPRAAPNPSHPSAASLGSIIGNRNSHVYHLPQGCPSYDRVAAKNRVPFDSEAEAQAAGYRKAGNCR